jgi:hypothetical protein
VGGEARPRWPAVVAARGGRSVDGMARGVTGGAPAFGAWGEEELNRLVFAVVHKIIFHFNFPKNYFFILFLFFYSYIKKTKIRKREKEKTL